MLIRIYNDVFFQIDDCDFHLLSDWAYYLKQSGYVGMYNKRTKEHKLLHRLILGVDDCNIQVDHIDGNKTNNSRYNLRLATASQNNMNRGPTKRNKTGKKGVSWNTKDKRYRAQISIDNRKIYLGSFLTIEEASAVYEAAAIRYFKEFNPCNK